MLLLLGFLKMNDWWCICLHSLCQCRTALKIREKGCTNLFLLWTWKRDLLGLTLTKIFWCDLCDHFQAQFLKGVAGGERNRCLLPVAWLINILKSTFIKIKWDPEWISKSIFPNHCWAHKKTRHTTKCQVEERWKGESKLWAERWTGRRARVSVSLRETAKTSLRKGALT